MVSIVCDKFENHSTILETNNSLRELRELLKTLGLVDGELYSIPNEVETLILYYNETLFEEMGRRERHRFLARLRAGLMALPDDALVFRAGITPSRTKRPPQRREYGRSSSRPSGRRRSRPCPPAMPRSRVIRAG